MTKVNKIRSRYGDAGSAAEVGPAQTLDHLLPPLRNFWGEFFSSLICFFWRLPWQPSLSSNHWRTKQSRETWIENDVKMWAGWQWYSAPSAKSWVKITAEQYWAVLSAHCSVLTAHYSLLTAHCSLLTAHCSLLSAQCSPTSASELERFLQYISSRWRSCIGLVFN